MNLRLLPPLLLSLAGLAAPAMAANDTMSAIKEAARAQANAKMAEKFNLPTAAPAGAKVYFLAPANNATVSSPVTVVFGLSGLGVAPAGTQIENTGHHHLLIDTDLPPFDEPIPNDRNHLHFGGGQTETILELPPGTHTLQLLMGDKEHIPHNPPVYSKKITITVR